MSKDLPQKLDFKNPDKFTANVRENRKAPGGRKGGLAA
jgi:hypothetical protein